MSATHSKTWQIYTDGAIRTRQQCSGLAAIVRDEHGVIRYLWKKRAGMMTCNEAEYAAAVFALERLSGLSRQDRPGIIILYCDSRVLVDQMTGRATARSPKLRVAQARLRELVASFQSVEFHHIRRDLNRLADALAFEAVESAVHSYTGSTPDPSPRFSLAAYLVGWLNELFPWRSL
jgi:ribonuclease HI